MVRESEDQAIHLDRPRIRPGQDLRVFAQALIRFRLCCVWDGATMIKRLNGLKGLILLAMGLAALAAACALPFLGLERFEGDAAPMIYGFVAAAVGIGFFVLAHRPAAFERYVMSVAIVFLVLMFIGVIGLLSSDNPAIGVGASLTPSGGSSWLWP